MRVPLNIIFSTKLPDQLVKKYMSSRVYKIIISMSFILSSTSLQRQNMVSNFSLKSVLILMQFFNDYTFYTIGGLEKRSIIFILVNFRICEKPNAPTPVYSISYNHQ